MAEPVARRLRVGVVGAGRIAGDYITVLSELDDVELAAVVDVSEVGTQRGC